MIVHDKYNNSISIFNDMVVLPGKSTTENFYEGWESLSRLPRVF